VWKETIGFQVVSVICLFSEQPVLNLAICVQAQREVKKVKRFTDLSVSKPDSQWFPQSVQKFNEQIELPG